MSKNRYSARTDDNEKDIVKDLRKLGYQVETGHDDILVAANNKTYWYEVKNPDEVDKDGLPYAKKSKTAKKQKKILDEFKGHYKIVSSLDEILNEINEG